VTEAVRSHWTAAPEWQAGGTDVQDRRNRGLSAGPVRDIAPTSERTTIRWLPDGTVRVGSLVRIETLAADPAVREAYRGVAAAAAGLATPQIRAVATVGGGLAQRSRCWYFRQPLFTCFKKGGDSCPARHGDHRLGVLVDLGPCVWPHPSTLGVAFAAYDGVVDTSRGRRLTMAGVFGDGTTAASDHLLDPDELIEAVTLPPPRRDERAGYLRGIARSAAEWPLVEVVIRLWLDGDVISEAVIAVGAIASVPLRATSAESLLRGCPVADVSVRLQDLTMPGTIVAAAAYKLPLLRGCIAAVVTQALAPEPPIPVDAVALDWSLP
jgi:xanthine dehydrogenase YagS FAD-binding subunit